MVEIAHPIEINLPAKLQDQEYRQKYFLAESSAQLAEQIAALRKLRGLNQTQLAEMVGTKQSAISRAEQADYQNWNFGTVRKMFSALDGRLRVTIEASEDVLSQYEEPKRSATEQKPFPGSDREAPERYSRFWAFANVQPMSWSDFEFSSWLIDSRTRPQPILPTVVASPVDPEIAKLKEENARLARENALLRVENELLKASAGNSAPPDRQGGLPTDFLRAALVVPKLPQPAQQ